MTVAENVLRASPFAIRIVERTQGRAAIIYRRKADPNRRDRFQRIAALSPLAFTVATPLLRDAICASRDSSSRRGAVALEVGPYHPLSSEWGPKVACFALIAAGLRDAERLLRALGHLRYANADEAAWWLGLLTREDNTRALRALRILTEAVE